MTQDTTYNGWTNYATWRVNLEIFDGMNITDYFDERPEVHDVRNWAKEYAAEMVAAEIPDGLALSYALAFIDQVDFWSIAERLIEAVDYAEEE